MPLVSKPWAVVARFDLKDGAHQEWLAIVEEVIDAMRHEPTFISTSLCADPSAPGRFMLFEVWQDRDEFFDVQANRNYRRTLMARLPDLVRSPVTFEEWNELRADYSIHVRR